jgi:hypothetical protein
LSSRLLAFRTDGLRTFLFLASFLLIFSSPLFAFQSIQQGDSSKILGISLQMEITGGHEGRAVISVTYIAGSGD